MSIIAPSRSDIAGNHFNGLLGSSAMPSTTAASLQPHNTLDKTRIDQIGQQNTIASIASWRKRVDHDPKHVEITNSAQGRERDVLTPIDSNQSSVSKVPKTVSISTSIPKPAVIPDVFEAGPNDRHRLLSAKSSLLTPLNSSNKRSRDVGLTSGVSGAKRSKVEGEQKQEEKDWKSKWVKIFPTLIFYFEIGTEGPGKVLEQRVKSMGAKVDQFFSARVTHLVAKSPAPDKKSMPPPSRKNNVKESPRNPFKDGTGETNLVAKAEALGMKVWTVDKLTNMLNLLAPVEIVANDSLHTLLEDERIHGTRERDATAPRPDYYYFKPGSKYLLIEDATGKSRTVMMKECSVSKDGPEWPVLYERFLRPSSANQCTVDPAKIRARAWSLYVERKPFEGEQPPQSDLKRSTSLRALPSTPKLPEAMPYQNASGNSVVLTSNIASTSAANPSSAAYGQNGMGMYKDRALMQMNKRVQVLKGNARLAAAKRDSATEASIAELTSRRASTGSTNPAPTIPPKTFLTHVQLARMLEQAREPVREKVSYEERVANRHKVESGLKGREQETASGYCENCRLRYNDLSVHIESRKHRKFATDPSNFASLDRLIGMLLRPPNPKLIDPEFPPCDEEHGKDDECELCYPTFNNEGDEAEMGFFDADKFEEDASERSEESGSSQQSGQSQETRETEWIGPSESHPSEVEESSGDVYKPE